MRIILYTGKGGVGKTSLAAATGLAAAAEGLKTLVISTDAAHSLGDSFDRELGHEPVCLTDHLWGQEISAITGAEQSWGTIQKYFSRLLASQDVKSIMAEELMAFPGLDELFSLFAILEHSRRNLYDLLIVDCASTGETLRLLSMPEIMQWWLEKIFPIQKMVLKVARPLARSLLQVPLPDPEVLSAVEVLFRQLGDVHALLTDWDTTSVRIVLNPEKMVIREAERSFMYLNLYGFNTDAVILNRLLPPDGLGEYFRHWQEAQQSYRQYVTDQFYPVPVLEVPLFAREVVGFTALRELSAACFAGRHPADCLHRGIAQQLREENDSRYVLELALNFAVKGSVALSQRGDELTVRVGDRKRNLFLPQKLKGWEATGAKLKDGVLSIVLENTERTKN